MTSVLDGVDLRTQMAGQNRLELLLFQLDTNQRFGINVFKVQEFLARHSRNQDVGAGLPANRDVAVARSARGQARSHKISWYFCPRFQL